MLPTRLCSALLALPALALGQGQALTPLMPGSHDHTLMFWADGFPGHTPAAPWHRVIRTGTYAMVLETETMRIPHLGPVADAGYLNAAQDTSQAWTTLPGADLDLRISAGGKSYRCVSGGAWSQFAGPRLIESGRFLQRADVTGLLFRADDGAELNAEARFETVAWPDRLGLILAARPGLQPIPPGEPCFGHEGGGFGLDGTNHFEVPHSPDLDPETFTLEFWAYIPENAQASPKTFPWLVCKNAHEQAEGNYGIVLLNGKAQARLNIGGGRSNAFTADAIHPPKTNAWNHLALSYDGNTLRLYQNHQLTGEKSIGRPRVPGTRSLTFGCRQDHSGDGYPFRGVIDGIRFYHRALTPAEWKSMNRPTPVRSFDFAANGPALAQQPRETWNNARLHLNLPAASLSSEVTVPGDAWAETGICFNPSNSQPHASTIKVKATALPTLTNCPVTFDPFRAWHRIDLDGIVPEGKDNDAIERVRFVLTNPSTSAQTARLLFAKDAPGGIRHRFGSPITGVSAILRSPDGHPTGIPVQLSKNWHNRPEGGVYSGQWFHGFSQVHLPPSAEIELELALVYGHWGGVAAASHAQLCLIGWGSNQLWDQSALGSWGESVCYEPDQVQAECGILDVRPLMVASLANNGRWGWTHNVGGGDFFRLFDSSGARQYPAGVRTAYLRQGPCLTEVTYAGRTGSGLRHHATASLGRTDDLVRATYHLRLDVDKPSPFSRFVIFQVGADTYNYTAERKFALGNESGLVREWKTTWGGNVYHGAPIEASGTVPWISLHDALPKTDPNSQGAWANRGIVIRAWKAQLGGKPASPWIAEHGTEARGTPSSTIDLLPPPDIHQLEPGDFVEATVEYLVVPQDAATYYGPNEALRTALQKDGNTWRMIQREAAGNDRKLTLTTGKLLRRYPDVHIATNQDQAAFTLSGGLGYVPVTFSGLSSPTGHWLKVDGEPLTQAVPGHDFWQSDYDPQSASWSLICNLPFSPGKSHTVQLSPTP
jgi:hypothetical protein